MVLPKVARVMWLDEPFKPIRHGPQAKDAPPDIGYFMQQQTNDTDTSAQRPVNVARRGAETILSIGSGATQSATLLDDPLTLPLAYTRFMMLACVLAPQLGSVLHIGLGGGTMARFLHACFPSLRQLAVEINPAVISAAYSDFGLDAVPTLEVLTGDAVALLPGIDERFDVVFLDAFDDDKTPEGLITADRLQLMGEHLNADGWLAANVYAGNLSVRALHRRWGEVFPQVLQTREPPLFWPVVFANTQAEPVNFVDLGARARELEACVPLPLAFMSAGLVPLRG